MKNWADASSDEESLDELPTQMEAQTLDEPTPPPPETVDAPVEEQETGDDADPAAPEAPKVRTYDFPDRPPFTAFVGNLAYALKDPEDLKAEVAKSAADHLGEELKILGARISFGRDGRHRGFGYVELETLDQLKTLMKLNDGECMLAGRKAQVDTANGPGRDHRGSKGNKGGFDVDGSKFRRGSRHDKDKGPPPQRSSLKLAPRTKKVNEDSQGTSSNIFGGARARDGSAWEERQKLSKHDNKPSAGRGNKDRNSKPNDRRRSSANKGDNVNSGRRNSAPKKNGDKVVPTEERAAKAAAQEKPAAAAAKPKMEPTNKFALLMDSDSD